MHVILAVKGDELHYKLFEYCLDLKWNKHGYYGNQSSLKSIRKMILNRVATSYNEQVFLCKVKTD